MRSAAPAAERAPSGMRTAIDDGDVRARERQAADERERLHERAIDGSMRKREGTEHAREVGFLLGTRIGAAEVAVRDALEGFEAACAAWVRGGDELRVQQAEQALDRAERHLRRLKAAKEAS